MVDFIQDLLTPLWHVLLARPSGPLSYRFILQPMVAAVAAIRAGLVDARTGRSPYFFALWTEPGERRLRLREGLSSTARIFALGLAMDAIYQFIVLKKLYPGETLIIAFVLAVVPYFLIRGPVARVARWLNARHLPPGTSARHRKS